MHRTSMFASLLVAAAAPAALGQPSPDEPALRELIEEAARASPEVAQARAEVEAQRARVPQAGALPDPSLTLGIQNDGFQRINVGSMETSFLNFMVTQPLPWPGKRGLREQVAAFDVQKAQAGLSRAMLDLEGRVRRAYLALLLARGDLELLDEQEKLWERAERTARTRYEAGQVPQSDLLRAQLERARLVQRRWALEADASTRVAELGRLRGAESGAAIPLGAPLREMADPPLPAEEAALAEAEQRSPEVLLATLAVEQAGRRVDLARRERAPDLAVAAAVMPRGALDPMWSLNVTVGLPIFLGSKQQRAVDESEHRRIAQASGAEAVRQILRLRTHERLAVLGALNRANGQYRRQILVLSSAAAKSTLTQYEAGRVPFAAVLEALLGYVADRAGHLASIAQAQLVAVAQRELSLEPVPVLGGSMGASAMPGTGSLPAAGAAATTNSSAEGAQERPGMKTGM
jgi:outer membrane protein TolC